MAENEQQAGAAETAPNPTFDIRKIYVKDASLESPNAPQIFLSEMSQPDINIDASIKTAQLEQDRYYEVVLGITVTSKVGDQTAFLVEVQQAGIFQISGLSDEDIALALEIASPNVLLPFAREAICDLVGKAGYPQLLLSPINFESLYMQKQKARAEAVQQKAEQENISEH